jgi:hypothetical protein
MPDEKIVPQIERQLSQCGLAGRWAIGKELAASAPYRLLQIAADYAARQRFRDLAALVRHPDVYDFVSGQLAVGRGAKSEITAQKSAIDMLTALDEYAAERFPALLDAERLQ